MRQDQDRRYALGTALLPLSDAATRLLSNWALPFLAQLAEQCGETANFAVLEDDHVIYVAQALGRHRMRMFTEVGRRALPHSTAVGKVLLAWQDDEQVHRVLTRLGLPARTPNTITTLGAFREELAVVRERGWAVDDEGRSPASAAWPHPSDPGRGRWWPSPSPLRPAGSRPVSRRSWTRCDGSPETSRAAWTAPPRRRARPRLPTGGKHVSGASGADLVT